MSSCGRLRQTLFQSLALCAALCVGPAAAQAADLYGNGSDLEAELRRMLESNEQEKRRTAIDRMAGLEPHIAAPYLIAKLRDSEPVVRAKAARALGPGAFLDAAQPLLLCMNDVEAPVRAACVEAFGQYGALPAELQKRAAITLARVVADAQYEVRLDVLRAIERLTRTAALSLDEQLHLLGPVLLRSEDEHAVVRRAACSALGYLAASFRDAKKRIAVALLGRLSDPARDVRFEAMASLTRLADPAATAAALRLLSDPADDVRRQAVLYLGQVGYAPALPLLSELLQHAPEPLRQSAAQAIAALLRSLAQAGGAAQASAQPAMNAALTALVQGLEREEVRPAARSALLAIGGLAVAPLVQQLAAAATPIPRALAIVDVLRDLVQPVQPPASPRLPVEARGPIGPALQAELVRARLPREHILSALSALSDPSLLPLFLSLIFDRDAHIRTAALSALSRLPQIDERAVDALLVTSRDPDAALRAQAAPILGRIVGPKPLARLRELLRDPAIEVRMAAVQGLVMAAEQSRAPARSTALDGSEAVALVALISRSADSPAEARLHRAAVQSLGALAACCQAARLQGTQALLAALRGLRPSSAAHNLVTALSAMLRHAAVLGPPLADLPQARSLLLDLATAGGEPDSEAAFLAADALDALSALGDGAVIGRVARLLSHPDPLRRSRAAAAIGSLLARVERSDGSVLISVLQQDRSARVVSEAAWALGKLPPEGAAAAVAALRQLLSQREGMGSERAVRANALGALSRLGRAEPGDAAWLAESEPVARANAALLLTSLREKTPGLLARLRNMAKTDPDHRVRAAAASAIANRGPAERTARGSFLGLMQLDVDQQPLADAPFRLTLPDGLSRIATTDRRGLVREEQVPPGGCEIEPLGEPL
ncbi:MAG: HEAT repeat domain-containing protein [Myxococcales bacterium]|nr:HEAT repeat domain-containing protein [Myxococcales bacterium]